MLLRALLTFYGLSCILNLMAVKGRGRERRPWAQAAIRPAGGLLVFVNAAELAKVLADTPQRVEYRVRAVNGHSQGFMVDVRPCSVNEGATNG